MERKINGYTISLYDENYILIEKGTDALYHSYINNDGVVIFRQCDGHLKPPPYILKIAKRCFLKWCKVVK